MNSIEIQILAERARALRIDVAPDVRDEAMRLKMEARRLLKTNLKDTDEDTLQDLLLVLDVVHRGRIPAIGL